MAKDLKITLVEYTLPLGSLEEMRILQRTRANCAGKWDLYEDLSLLDGIESVLYAGQFAPEVTLRLRSLMSADLKRKVLELVRCHAGPV